MADVVATGQYFVISGGMFLLFHLKITTEAIREGAKWTCPLPPLASWHDLSAYIFIIQVLAAGPTENDFLWA